MPDDPSRELPHGPAFRFVDQVTSLTPGQSATATYHVRGDEPFLAGHFPGNPIMPGVILVEAAAQLGGIVAQSDPDNTPLDDLRLTAVRNAKITGTARPGESLEIAASVTGRLGTLVQVDATVAVAGRTVLRTALTLTGSAPAPAPPPPPP